MEMTDQLSDGLLIEPAPGHTPGQVIFRLLDGGEEAVFPGDTLHVHVLKERTRGNVWKFSAQAKVNGLTVAVATFTAMILDE